MKLTAFLILALAGSAAAAPRWGMPYTIQAHFEAITANLTTYKGPIVLYWDEAQQGYAFDAGYGTVTINEGVDGLTYTTNGAVADWRNGIEGRTLVGTDYLIFPLSCDYGWGTQPLPTMGMALMGMATGIFLALLSTLWTAPFHGFRGVAQ